MLSAGKKKIIFCTYSSHRADSLRREVPAQLLNNAVFLLFPLLLLLFLISPLSSATLFLLTLFTFTAFLFIYIFVALITCKYSKTTLTDHEMSLKSLRKVFD